MRFILTQLILLSSFASAEPVCTVFGVHGLRVGWTIAIEDPTSAAISAPKNQFYDCKTLAATLADWQKSGQCYVDWNKVSAETSGVLDIQSMSSYVQYTKAGCQKQFDKAAKSAPSQHATAGPTNPPLAHADSSS